MLIVATFTTSMFAPNHYVAAYFLVEQDILVAASFIVVALLAYELAVRMHRLAHVNPLPWSAQRDAVVIGACAVMVFGLALAGRHIVLLSFPLSMDEFWAIADGDAFVRGQPMGRIPPAWREYADALYPIFATMRPEAGLVISDYLPLNALIQLALGPFASPLMAAGACVLTASIASKVAPEIPRAPIIAVVLLATSAQLVFTAMTPYAMSAHLFFNLLWLRLFLVRSLPAQGAAMTVALVAMGLHQNAMFPLFAVPFLLEAFIARRRVAALAHFLVIAAGFLAWANYDHFAFGWFNTVRPVVGEAGSNGMLGDLRARLSAIDLQAITLMGSNLVRMVAWQNPLTVPLIVVGTWYVARRPGPLRAMLLGIVLTCGFMLFVIPLQGHGWGYRYVHGLLGSMAILASVTLGRMMRVRSSEDSAGKGQRRPSIILFAAVMTGLAIALLPLRAYQAHVFAAPYARADEAIAGIDDADIIVIDAPGYAYAIDLTRNDVFASNRPLRMARKALSASQLEKLCEEYAVARFDGQDAARFGLLEYPFAVHERPWPAKCD